MKLDFSSRVATEFDVVATSVIKFPLELLFVGFGIMIETLNLRGRASVDPSSSIVHLWVAERRAAKLPPLEM